MSIIKLYSHNRYFIATPCIHSFINKLFSNSSWSILQWNYDCNIHFFLSDVMSNNKNIFFKVKRIGKKHEMDL